MRDPKHLDNNDYLAMAESIEVHCKEEQIFGRDWYNQTAMPLKSWMPSMKKWTSLTLFVN
jgi:hypothetical protein